MRNGYCDTLRQRHCTLPPTQAIRNDAYKPCVLRQIVTGRRGLVVTNFQSATPSAPSATPSVHKHSGEVAYEKLQQQKLPIDKYLYLRDLFTADQDTYYKLLLSRTEEALPFIYTPTVGEACQKYHSLPLETHGLYLCFKDKGQILSKLKQWEAVNQKDVRVIVVTDGERILGLGDLGANGMGISEGKITLYTAAAGVDPALCMPICLDVGTNTRSLLEDPQYRGLRLLRGEVGQYDALLHEFMCALHAWKPHVMLQFEDFGNTNAFRLLDRYTPTHCCFNDDIQGTASITLAALLAGFRANGGHLEEQRVLFLGAGEAGTGIGELIAFHMHRHKGVSMEEARKMCYFVDSKGLVRAERAPALQHHKLPFAHQGLPECNDLKEAILKLKPTALIGVSTIPQSFDEEVVRLMSELNDHPIIFPLSNPTSKSECTYEQAYKWSNGRVLFSSGSPFGDVAGADGVWHHPAQANNAYIFPAVGHAAVLTNARTIDQEVFMVAAEALAQLSPVEEIKKGWLFPPFSQIKAVSAHIMAHVCEYMVSTGAGTRPEGVISYHDWKKYCVEHMWPADQRPKI